MNHFDYIEFINRHPIRYLCRESPVDFLFNQAVILSDRLIEYLSQSCEIPVSPEILEEMLTSRNIIIEKLERATTIHHDSWHMLAWTDPETKTIHIDENALKKIIGAQSERKGARIPSFQEARGIILAHEWFHILSEQIEKIQDWQILKKAERIIIEEIAARLFGARLTGRYADSFLIDEMIQNAHFHQIPEVK